MNDDLTSAPQRENPWKLALEGLGVGVWDWNLATGEQTHSARWEEMLGFQAGSLTRGYQDFVARVHPDDLARVQDASMAYAEGRVPTYVVEFRMRCKDGDWKWISACGTIVQHDAQGKPLRMIGTHTDISGRKQSEANLQAVNAELVENAQLLQTTLTSISQGILLVDANDRVRMFNPRVCELLDLPKELLASKPSMQALARYQFERGDFGPDADLVGTDARAHIMEVASGAADTQPCQYLRQTQDGRTLEVRSQSLPSGGMVRTVADVTDHVQAAASAKESEDRWKLALESTGDGVWDWYVQTGKEFFSPRLLQMCGYGDDDLNSLAEEFDNRTHPDDMAQLKRARLDHFEGRTPSYQSERRIRCKDGDWKWVLSRGMVISRDAQGQPLRMIGTFTDVSSRKESEAVIRHQAFYDALTGLPNRRMLRERLEQEIRKCKRDHLQLALLFIDLDNFKEVNDTLGHDSGDVLLVEAGRRLQACVRQSDTVARMGGDEFTVILAELPNSDHLEGTLQKILHALAEVFQLGNEQVFVSASIGITIYPIDATPIEDLFKNADQALYVAKGAGRNRFSFFTPALQDAAQNRVRLTGDLRTALTEQQFRVVYQPIVDLATGAIHKAEALIRWHHPVRGLVSPAAFIPIAESSGLIVDIGEWVFQQAAHQVEAWRAKLAPDFQISVNKSPVQFQHSESCKVAWAQDLQQRGLPGDCIVVEITEGLLLDTSNSVADSLLGLSDAGIQVSLDDFGTGYSSLSYLQKFDIDFLKIDQSFVRHLIADSTDLELCKAIIVMAHALGIKVIAEGVETELQRDLLAQAGCDYVQGYLYARPMSAPDFETFIAAYTAVPQVCALESGR
jgi:diguanylate cyclase (GGDEF)-like protein/PAS domain S-box-containing protein